MARWKILKEFPCLQTSGHSRIEFRIVQVNDKTPVLDIRTFVEGQNYKGPTKKGIQLNLKMLQQIQQDKVINEAIAIMSESEK